MSTKRSDTDSVVEPIRKRYFEWLAGLVCDMSRDDGCGYRLLMKKLHDIEFYWTIDNDVNRASDGKELRGRFVDECYIGPEENFDAINGVCTVLEMLVGLAIRWNDCVASSDVEDNAHEYFWILMKNLGLDMQDDKHFDADFVVKTVEKWLNHEYGVDGKGGIFPLKLVCDDQTKVEIWYQLQNYLMENYDF